MVGVYPKKNKSDVVYYVKKLNYRFSLPKIDAEGKPMQKVNPITGLPVFTPKGEPEFIEEGYSFDPWKTRFSEEGYCSVFVVTKETPKRIADELKNDAADRTCGIMDEKTYIKTTNPDLAEKLAADEAAASEIAEKAAKIDEQAAEIARLKEKLSGGQNRR